jgi:uncharacterized protein
MTGIRFRTTDGLTLEGEIREADGKPRGTAVICHPHPRHGGSKDHPVLWAIRNHLAARQGLTVLAFNFRGIMGSEGEFGGGEAEVADARAATDRVREEAPGPTVLVGWSFGACVALHHAVGDPRVAAVALVGMPLDETGDVAVPPPPGQDVLEGFTVPTLLVAGDRDRFSPVGEVAALAGMLPRSETAVIEDAGHFFRRREARVAEVIGRFVDRALG